MKARFSLDLTPNAHWGMNQVYSGKHWSIRKEQAAQVHLLVRSAIRRQNRSVRKFQHPVNVRISYNSRLDIDNHGYLAKLIIDGMKGVLLEDDDRRFVKSLTQSFHSGDRGKILVEVEEVGAADDASETREDQRCGAFHDSTCKTHP